MGWWGSRGSRDPGGGGNQGGSVVKGWWGLGVGIERSSG